MLKLCDEGYDMPRGAFLISPWADTTGSEETFDTNYGNDVMFGEKGKKSHQRNGKQFSKAIFLDLWVMLSEKIHIFHQSMAIITDFHRCSLLQAVMKCF